jgi:hypothetical protein
VADALSKRNEGEMQTASLAVISNPSLEWLLEVKEGYTHDPTLQSLVQKVEEGLMANSKFSIRQGILLYKKRVYIPNTWQEKVLQFVHSSSLARHASYDKTIHRARKDFFWPGIKSNVKRFIRECDICQRVKAENVSPVGLLQPLPIPERPWLSISMDFIEGLPLSQGYSVIWVVVDRLTKYAHFIALKHPYTADKLAHIFMNQLFKLHGMLQTIISDRDSTLTADFGLRSLNCRECSYLSVLYITLSQMANLKL